MSIYIELTPQEEDLFRAYARQAGDDPAELARTILIASDSNPCATHMSG